MCVRMFQGQAGTSSGLLQQEKKFNMFCAVMFCNNKQWQIAMVRYLYALTASFHYNLGFSDLFCQAAKCCVVGNILLEQIKAFYKQKAAIEVNIMRC